METLPYLLPWFLFLLAAGVAVAVKMLPLKSIPGIAVTAVISLIFLGLSIYSNVITGQLFDRIDEKQQQLADMEAWKYKHLDELALLIAQLKPPADEDAALLKELHGYGWQSESTLIRQMRDAHAARERILAEFKPSQPMLIKGIPQSVNEQLVDLALRQVGFTVLPYRDDEQPEADANIIYYGRDMQLPEIKLAALTLMRAGIDLKGIKPFPKPTSGNLRAIKIEWNRYFESRKGMTANDVESAQNFN
ncbi:MAG: hypothetical protein R3F47_04310 [Gammaproteobacteria bacterium]